MSLRRCTHILASGRPCRATPQRDVPLCFWHDPGRAEDLAEARRLGGLRRRRERTIAGAYDFGGLGDVEAIRRLLEIAAIDAIELTNSVPRGRILVATAAAATRLLEVGELSDRVEALEAARRAERQVRPDQDVTIEGEPRIEDEA